MKNIVKNIIENIIATFVLMMVMAVTFILVLFLRGIPAQAAELNEYQAVLDKATNEDYRAMEFVVYYESARADCDFEVNVAVVETILNRCISEDWPDTPYEVCTQKGQFVCKAIPANVPEETWEAISDAIEHVVHEGLTVLPSTNYHYFATKKQSYAKNHVWIGATKDGKPKKGKGMYFGEEK